jgi:hypothetical protein
MRIRSCGTAGSLAAIALALVCAPAIASKPTQSRAMTAQKIDPRGGPPVRVDGGKRPGFSVSTGRDRHDRDDDRWDDDRGDDRHDDRWDDRDDDHRDGRWDHDNDRHDDRWRHDDRYDYSTRYDHRYYPRPGYVVYRLPPRHRVVQYYGVPYYYGDGSWYRPYGTNFSVVAPPIGLTVSFLPDVYTTLWIGGIQYYCANDVYYRWHGDRRAYVVTGFPHGVY